MLGITEGSQRVLPNSILQEATSQLPKSVLERSSVWVLVGSSRSAWPSTHPIASAFDPEEGLT